MSSQIDTVGTVDLTGLVVAFYENSKKPKNPSDYFCLGHVTGQEYREHDKAVITNPIKVTSLDREKYYYFGMEFGATWCLLLEDPLGRLVIHGRSPDFSYDIVP